MYGWKPVCILEQCKDWAIGDEWISENCRPKQVDGEDILTCNIVVNGQKYNIPLSTLREKVNVSELKSCKKFGMNCVKEVYIKEEK